MRNYASPRIIYGPEPFISQNNPEWSQMRADSVPSIETEKAYSPNQKSLPPAKCVDLYHLSQQSFSNNTPAFKRYFLTALVLPEDQHLLHRPPSDEAQHTIEAHIASIARILNTPAANIEWEDLDSLKKELCALYKMPQWLGEGLHMVDQNTLSIDILNTLITWQSVTIQFGDDAFSLFKMSPSTRLRSRQESYTTSSSATPCLHEVIFSSTVLSESELCETEYGKIVMQQNQLKWAGHPNAEEHLHDFEPIAHYHFKNSDDFHQFQFPSTLLEEDCLTQNKRWVIPVPAFGYHYLEDYMAASAEGARLVQAYLPGAKGNVYNVHGKYHGESLVQQHDFSHVQSDIYTRNDPESLKRIMVLAAIMVNAYITVGDIEQANNIIDLDNKNIMQGSLAQFEFIGEKPEIQRTFLVTLYTELALAAGIAPEKVSCTKISADHFDIDIVCAEKRMKGNFFLKIGGDWGEHFYCHFNEMQKHRSQTGNIPLPSSGNRTTSQHTLK